MSLNQSEYSISHPIKAKARHEFEIEFAEALYAPGKLSLTYFRPTHLFYRLANFLNIGRFIFISNR